MKYLVMLFTTLFLVACGGQTGNTTPTSGTSQTGTDATAEAVGGENTGTDALTETATSEDGALTVMYPAGWFVNAGIGQITLANNEALLASMDDPGATPEADQVAMSIFGGSGDEMPPSADGQPMTVRNVLDLMSGEMSGQEGLTVSEPEEFTVNGRDAASITGTEGNRDLMLTVTETESGHFVVVAFTGMAGSSNQYRDLVRSIAGSATFDPTAVSTPEMDADMTEDATPEMDEDMTEEATPES